MDRFQPGDHLRVWCGAFWHHGIYFGDGWVIHMSGLAHGKSAATVRWGRIERFAGKQGMAAIEVVQYGRCDPVPTVLARARQLLDRGNYHVLENNCEQCARWCKTGHFVSQQVEAAKAAGIGVGGGAGATVAAMGIATSAGTSAAGIVSSLAGAGAALGGGVTTGVVMLAAAPSAVATVAVRRGYRDDPTLPQAERTARANARTAGTVGAAGATLGTLAAISALGVPGLAADGIASGLAALGGSMLGGVAVSVAAPAVLAAGAAYMAYRISRRRHGLR
jgi:hypothetical protein